MKRCLVCYRELTLHEVDFHAPCAKSVFGHAVPPLLPYTENDMPQLASGVLQLQSVVTGVQPKLSLHISPMRKHDAQRRFTIVGVWGGYILKPQTDRYPMLPEVEDLTMHLARLANIITVPHCLVRMQSGGLAYLTKRVDRTAAGKLAMEDMCQLTERGTEHKYRGSYEQIAKTIQRYSSNPGLDVVTFFEVLLFSYLTGNADMHLKNFSLLEHRGYGMTLSPAYDLVNTAVVNPSDQEELALTLRGKKRNITRRDFEETMHAFELGQRQQENLFAKMERSIPQWMQCIDTSFLSQDMKQAYADVIMQRAERLQLLV